MVRFLHVSDTHIGSRQYMSDIREQDFYDAFTEVVDIAIREKVDFIVHSGDLFDTWSPSNRALVFFRDQAMRLRDAGIHTYMIMGDHDRPKRADYPAADIFDFLGITLLGAENVEYSVFQSPDEEILIAGISNMKGLRKDRLAEEYRKSDEKAKEYQSSILISHQGVKGFLHDDAIEVKKEDLPKNFSYLAFGHVHDSALQLQRRPVFAYAGSTELKSDREVNYYLKYGKAVNIVDLKAGQVQVKRTVLTATRPQLLLDTDYDHYLDDIRNGIEKYGQRFGTKEPYITLKVNGDGDKDEVRHRLKEIGSAIFRPPIFSQASASPEVKVGVNNATEFIQEYFREDPDLMNLTLSFFREYRDNPEEAIAFLKTKLENYKEGPT